VPHSTFALGLTKIRSRAALSHPPSQGAVIVRGGAAINLSGRLRRRHGRKAKLDGHA